MWYVPTRGSPFARANPRPSIPTGPGVEACTTVGPKRAAPSSNLPLGTHTNSICRYPGIGTAHLGGTLRMFPSPGTAVRVLVNTVNSRPLANASAATPRTNRATPLTSPRVSVNRAIRTARGYHPLSTPTLLVGTASLEIPYDLAPRH